MKCKICGDSFEGHHLQESCGTCKTKKKKQAVKTCRREREREFLNVLDEAKKAPCFICKKTFPSVCMDLDHIDPSVKDGGRSNRFHAVKGEAAARALLEICQIICSNCHRVKTDEESDNLKGACVPTRGRAGNQKPSLYRKLEERRTLAKETIILAKDNPCSDCGEKFPPVAMDFDHLHDKKVSISALVRLNPTQNRLTEEISKCELVCSNCHRIRTNARE